MPPLDQAQLETFTLNLEEILATIREKRGESYTSILALLFSVASNTEQLEGIACDHTIKFANSIQYFIARAPEDAEPKLVDQLHETISETKLLHDAGHDLAKVNIESIETLVAILSQIPDYAGLGLDMSTLVKKLNKDLGPNKHYG